MPRKFAVLPLLVFFALSCLGAEKKAAHEDSSPQMEIGIYRVPPSVFSTADPSDKNGNRKYLKGIKSTHRPESLQFDIKEYLELQGVTFPPRSFAIYDQNQSSVLAYNTPENLDLIDMTFGPNNRFPNPEMVSIELSAIECSLPSDKILPSSKQTAYAELEKLAGKSMKLLDRASVITNSGQRCVFSHILNPAADHPPASESKPDDMQKSFASTESGTKAEIEAVCGLATPDIDFNMYYRFQQAAGKTNGNTALSITFTTSFTAWDDYPVVLHVSPIPNHEGKFLAVVLRARIVNPGGWKPKDARDAAKKNAK
jgi:hypothetical protein